MTVDRRWLAFVGMWVAAIAAMVVIYVTQERAPDPRARSADAAPVHDHQARAEGAITSAPPRPAEPGPPRQFRSDRRHTARSAFAGPASAALAWEVETGGHVSAQPVVGEDGTIYVGSHDHHLYAITRDGRVRWRRDLGGPIYSTAALADGRVYVGSDADRFFAIDATSGEIVWHLDTEDDADTGVAIAPDGTLVFGAGEDVFAVDREGTVRWRFRTGLKVFATPAIDEDGTVYVGSQDDHVYAIAPDGRMRWRFQTRDDVDGSPAIGDDGTIYAGSDDHRVYALHRDGTLRWSTDVDGDVRAPLGLGEGVVYAGVFAPHPRVVALDAASGQERWSFAITAGESGGSVSSGPLVDRDGNVYFGADDDFVYSLDPGGRLRWFFRAHGNVDGEPIITPEGLLIVGADDHRVRALRAE
ncbi:PQQ-binding-like beta-propeller repeat protein [Sandaracinus amylolyticus]|uniref:Cell surface protein n=1 Tax=Sandaracinus amylolyticus TaxID=927083 RepID=A0A0F6YKQ6_9BACT|nr:PQQ-binding-like beta-propeller repeat protein [Sandaracinus amylolyticus]AKF08416.1 Cell surface protein [Sandaracinus amylolyticus]